MVSSVDYRKVLRGQDGFLPDLDGLIPHLIEIVDIVLRS